MKHKKHKDKSKHERKRSKKKNKRRHKSQNHDESDSTNSSSENEQEWVEKSVTDIKLPKQNVADKLNEQASLKREDWMNIKTVFPCVFNEKPATSTNIGKIDDKPDLDKLGQTDKELNPYWKNDGNGLPKENLIKEQPVIDVNWLRKSFQRAKEQAINENRSLADVAAERWGSLETIQSMISKAEEASIKNKYGHKDNTRFLHHSSKWETDDHFTTKSGSLNKNQQYRKHDNLENKKQKWEYKKPMYDDCFKNTSIYEKNYSSKRNWQKDKISNKKEENQLVSSASELKNISPQNDINTIDEEAKEIKHLTEAEMNKLGAKIVKAEIMGNTKLAYELKNQLNEAREQMKERTEANSVQSHNKEKIQTVILTQTDAKGVTRPLDPRNEVPGSSKNVKRKSAETYVSGKKVRHYFDDDKYSLEQLFQQEKGRCTNEDDAILMKAASKNMDMDEIFEEQITHVKSDAKRNNKDRSVAIKEYKHLSKSLDNCRWCIDSKYMLKHMIITMDSEVCLSLPPYASLTAGHCIITPIQHIACQLQLDENIWEKLKAFKRILYKIFLDQNQYPIFYEIYNNRRKFHHMQLQCVPLPKEVGELAPMYFKKALLECETEWSMNKKVISLENKDVRHSIPNGLSYFMVEFEQNKGYAHIIEDEHMFPKNFAEEIIGGMLDIDHDIWRKLKNENFDQQREKVLKFSEIWKNYESEIKKL